MKEVYQTNWIAMDINLMQKNSIKGKSILLPILLILMAVSISIAVGWYWYETRSKLAEVKQQLALVTHNAAELEAKLAGQSSNGQLSALIEQPQMLKRSKPTMTQLITQLNQLIPKYANVTQLDLNEQGELKLTFYYARTEDIISFSQSIQASANFELVQMGTINTINNRVEQEGAAISDTQTKAESIKLPIYQTTFDLKYKINENRENKGN